MEQDILYKTCGDIFPTTYTNFRKVLQIKDPLLNRKHRVFIKKKMVCRTEGDH